MEERTDRRGVDGQAAEGRAMRGKTVLITGASGGIGKETAWALAHLGARVVLVARDRQRGAAAAAAIRSASGNPDVEVLLADLSAQRAIRQLAADFAARHARLDVLINNVGGQFGRRRLTDDGLEYTFALNHLGPFLLTALLLPTLARSAPARVVTVASSAEAMGRIDFDDLQGARRYGFSRAYGQSKLANVLFTYELARRLGGAGVTANAVFPGFVRSGFYDDARGAFRIFRDLVIYPFLAATPAAGADTAVYLASSPEVAGETGGCWAKRRRARSSARSRDAATARRLWAISEELTGLRGTADAATSRIGERGALPAG